MRILEAVGPLFGMAGEAHLGLGLLLPHRILGGMNRVAVGAGDAGALHGAALPVDEHASLVAALAHRVAVGDRRGVGTLEDHARLAIAAFRSAGDVRRARAVAGFAASLRHRRLRIALHGHRRRLQERLDVIVLTVTAQAGLRIAFDVAAIVGDWAGLFDFGRFGARGRCLRHDQIRFCGRDRLNVIEQRRINLVGDRLRGRSGGDGWIRRGGVRRLNEITQHGIIIRGGRRLSGCGRLGETKQRRKNHARQEKRDRSLARFVCRPCAPIHLPIGRRNRPRVSNFAAHAPRPIYVAAPATIAQSPVNPNSAPEPPLDRPISH